MDSLPLSLSLSLSSHLFVHLTMATSTAIGPDLLLTPTPNPTLLLLSTVPGTPTSPPVSTAGLTTAAENITTAAAAAAATPTVPLTTSLAGNQTAFNGTELPQVAEQAAGMGMVLVPFGIITVLALLIIVVSRAFF